MNGRNYTRKNPLCKSGNVLIFFSYFGNIFTVIQAADPSFPFNLSQATNLKVPQISTSVWPR